jgi:hypothetical protein
MPYIREGGLVSAYASCACAMSACRLDSIESLTEVSTGIGEHG